MDSSVKNVHSASVAVARDAKSKKSKKQKHIFHFDALQYASLENSSPLFTDLSPLPFFQEQKFGLTKRGSFSFMFYVILATLIDLRFTPVGRSVSALQWVGRVSD